MGNSCIQRQRKVVQVVDNADIAKNVSMRSPPSTNIAPLLGATDQSKMSSHPLPIPTSSSQAYSSGQEKNAATLPTPRMVTEISPSQNLKAFVYSELQIATRNFSPDILLGEGGFGCVYKGWLERDTLNASKSKSGIAVAVKKLKTKGFQGHKEWLSEINYLGQLHHPNLVKLIGYCVEAENRLLVYEYMPKGSLENHLFRRTKPLPWATRLKIAEGAARGLCFLHNSESQVIYRDFKSSNILLDSGYNTKLSDFGLAKAGPTGDRTHVSTEVMGTEGYTAPEYIRTGRLTTHCDVYSFGIVLLELLTGRRAVDETRGKEKKLLDWARPLIVEKGKVYRIMDSSLEGQYPRKAAFFVATLGLQCIQSNPRARPCMSDVLKFFENSSTGTLLLPTTPEMIHSAPPGGHGHHSSSRGPVSDSQPIGCTDSVQG